MIIKKYSELPSFIGDIRTDDCVFWGRTQHDAENYIHQRVYLYDYRRLIDSGRASYEFLFDYGGINA